MTKKITTNNLIQKSLNIKRLKIVKKKKFDFKNFILCNYVLKDMLYYIQIWRQIKGYSSNGQRSHSNNKNNKKNKILNDFRYLQFLQIFGKKKKNNFSMLIVSEYTNRLWWKNWHIEWLQASLFVRRLSLGAKSNNTVKFDPHLLSKNIITGIIKVKKKKKHNVAKKKIILAATIGLPVLFSLNLFNKGKKKKILPFKLVLANESKKKVVNKLRKKKKKK